MIGYLRFAIISLALCFAAPAFSEPLKSVLEAFLVVTENVDDKKVEKLVPVDEAAPDAVIEYVLTYTNVSDQALSGFAIKTPIPASTTYVATSATSDVKADFLVSIDGGATFEKEPVTRTVIENGKAKEIIIPPSEYDTLSWNIQKKLKSEKSMVMRYRVTID